MLGMSKLELLSRFPLPRPCPFPPFPIFIFWLKPWIVEMAAFAKQAVFLSSLWATGRTWWPWPPFTNALLVVSMNGRLLVFSINEGKAFYYHKISQNSEQTCFVFYFCRKQAWVKIKKRHAEFKKINKNSKKYRKAGVFPTKRANLKKYSLRSVRASPVRKTFCKVSKSVPNKWLNSLP